MSERFDLSVSVQSSSTTNERDVLAAGVKVGGLTALNRLSHNLRLDLNSSAPLSINTERISNLKSLYLESSQPVDISIPASVSVQCAGVWQPEDTWTIQVTRLVAGVLQLTTYTIVGNSTTNSVTATSLADVAQALGYLIATDVSNAFIVKVAGNSFTVSTKTDEYFDVVITTTGLAIGTQKKSNALALTGSNLFLFQSKTGAPIAKTISIKASAPNLVTDLQLIMLGD